TDPNTGGAVRAVQQLALLTVGGDDTITGGDGADQIFGGKGDDTIRTGDGENYVEGNQGTDTIFGGPGGNDIVGGTSPLTLPTSGADALTVAQVPDAGDTIYADGRTGGLPATPDTGDVVLGDNGCISRGTGGAPTLANGCPTGPSSAPTAWQFSAADLGSVDAGHPNGNLVRPVVRQLDVTDCPGGGSCTVDSRGGSDTIYGGSGDDVLLGETGNDRIFGGPDGTNGVDDTTGVFVGNDDVEGGAGSDTIAGGAGDDDLIGGTAPTYLPTGVTTSLVSDGTAGGAPLTVPGNPLLTIPGTGTLGNTIDGGGGADVILGGNGVITRTVSNGVWAVNGNDHAFIRTQADLDLLTIGGDDTLRGNLGDDKIFGALGNDTISGGFDDDYLEGGPGRNLVQGGQGADDIVGGTSPIALPSPPSGKTNDDVAAATPSGTDAGGGQRDGNVLCGFVCGGSTAAGDDDVIAANNARIDRCPATVSGGKGTPAGSDACTWGTTDYGNEKVGSAPGVAQSGAISTTGLGVARTRYVTLLGQSPTNTTSDGNDYVEGDSGNDVLYGEDGSDAVHGDTPLAGSPRVDECLATGPDANAGQDVIVGGYGSDTLCGDGGDDGIVGTRGLVTIVPFAKGSGPTTIGTTGGPPYGTFTYPSSGDTIDRVDLSKEYVNGVLTAVPNWNVATAAGQNSQHDVEFGGQGNDALHGSPGDDFLEGDDGPHVAGAPASTGGDDVLFGGDGNDSLQGGPGNDHAWGGTGNDDLDLRRSDSGIALKVNESRACQAMLFPTLTVAPAALLAAEGCSSTGYGMQSYASRFPLVSGSYDTDPGGDDNGGTGKNTSLFGDIMYGGFNRDVMQSQPTGLGDRMIDDNGAYNLEYVCTAPYGGWQINRALSPGLRSFVQQLAQADGAVDPATVTSSGGYEASIIYPGDAKGNAGQDYPGTPGHFTC
ncbi:MAG: calcium-binding protein, partial [Jatrophihabitans sp.]|uniref:calcium-binding protein n=1 Tax=Jatrophihabitans sp. TaxID=1932789 RepID=UPI003F7E4DF9